MKRFISISILLAGLIAVGCGKTGTGGGGDTDEVNYLKVRPAIPIVFTAAATETHDITVTTDQSNWDAVPDQDWCVVSDKTATGFRISALPNDKATPPPTATVTVSAGTAKPVTIIVTQLGYKKPEDTLTEVIMFTHGDAGGTYLCVMKPDGTGIRVVHDSADPELPKQMRGALNPDGDKAVMLDEDNNMYISNIGGTVQKIVTANASWSADQAVWSPDGARILYSNTADGYKLETVKPDGSDIQVLTDENYSLGTACYTADGTRIIATNALEHKYICSMAADGTGIAKIVEAVADTEIYGAIPVSDSRILYYSVGDSGISIWSAGIDGTGPVELDALDVSFTKATPLSVNTNGSIICYALYDSEYHLFVRGFDGTTLGTETKLYDGNYTNMRFGMIKQSLFDALPLFDPDGE